MDIINDPVLDGEKARRCITRQHLLLLESHYSTTFTCQLLLSNPEYESVVQRPYGAISSKYKGLDFLTKKGISLPQL